MTLERWSENIRSGIVVCLCCFLIANKINEMKILDSHTNEPEFRSNEERLKAGLDKCYNRHVYVNACIAGIAYISSVQNEIHLLVTLINL